MLRGTIRRRPLLVEEVDEFGGFIVVVLLVTGVKQSQLLDLSLGLGQVLDKNKHHTAIMVSCRRENFSYQKGAVHGWFHEAFLAAVFLFLHRLG